MFPLLCVNVEPKTQKISASPNKKTQPRTKKKHSFPRETMETDFTNLTYKSKMSNFDWYMEVSVIALLMSMILVHFAWWHTKNVMRKSHEEEEISLYQVHDFELIFGFIDNLLSIWLRRQSYKFL